VGQIPTQVQVKEHQQTSTAKEATHQEALYAVPTTTAGEQGNCNDAFPPPQPESKVASCNVSCTPFPLLHYVNKHVELYSTTVVVNECAGCKQIRHQVWKNKMQERVVDRWAGTCECPMALMVDRMHTLTCVSTGHVRTAVLLVLVL